MATRSNIICKIGETFTQSYCHFDGYLDHNGVILFENYTTQEKVEELVGKGYLSGLDADIEKVELINDWQPANEGRNDPRTNPDDYLKEEYNYLWDGEKWLVSDYSDFPKGVWKDLCEAIEEEKRQKALEDEEYDSIGC